MASLSFDPRDPVVLRDPYPAYAALREDDPVHRVASARTWFVAGHEQCRAVLTDGRFSAAQGQGLRTRSTPLPSTMLNADPPEHHRLRGAVSAAFTPAAMVAAQRWLQPMVEDAVRGAVATLDSGAEVDLVADVARPLAVGVLGRLLGLTDQDLPELATWASAVGVNLDPFADPGRSSVAEEAMQAMLSRFADLMGAPADGDGALAILARSHAMGVVSPGEALSTAGLLVVGGFDPLVAFVSNSVAALLAAPGSSAPVGPARSVVDELLRYDPPIQFTARRALTEVELGTVRIPAGDHAVVLLGSANRDPARFDDPDRLVWGRRSNPHLSFGAGRHVCLGAPLARLFGELLLAAAPGSVPPVEVRRVARSTAVVPRGHRRLVVARSGQR